MKQLIIGIMALLLAGGQADSAAARTDHIQWFSSLDEAKILAGEQGKPIMVYFYTTWCSWCTKLDRDTYADKRVVAATRDFVCVKINGDTQKALVRELRVPGYPTVAFFTADGTVIDRFPGFYPPDRFLDLLADMMRKAFPAP